MNFLHAMLLLGLVAFSPGLSAASEKPTVAIPNLDALTKATSAQVENFFNSSDYQKLKRTDAEFLRDVYRAVLQREPDEKGFENWLAVLQNAHDPKIRQNAVKTFLDSAEYARLHESPKPVVPKKDTSRNPANVLFDGTGVFVNSAEAFPADRYAALLKKAKVTWIALQIDNGGGARTDNVAAIQGERLRPDQDGRDIRPPWADAWRKAGFKVGFWGCPRGVNQHDSQSAVDAAIPIVQADAELAVKLTAQYHGDLYIADCEAPYQSWSQKDPAPALNRVYVDAFKRAADAAGIGKIPRALSSMGRVALDMQPWIDAGWDALPQAYWNSYAVYQPSLCVDFYVKETGWPIGRVHPTIATYTGEGENRKVTLQDYAIDLKKRPTVGFSYYLPESYLRLDETLYQQLATMSSR
jgi:hypothetical protein